MKKRKQKKRKQIKHEFYIILKETYWIYNEPPYSTLEELLWDELNSILGWVGLEYELSESLR